MESGSRIKIPNGMWFLRVQTLCSESNGIRSGSGDMIVQRMSFRIIGGEGGFEPRLALMGHRISPKRGRHARSSEFCYTHTAPFGAIVELTENGNRIAGPWLFSAKLVHQGRPRNWRIVRPAPYAYEPGDNGRVAGWVTLADLAAFVELPAYELVHGYLDFALASGGSFQVLLGVTEAEIMRQKLPGGTYQFFTRETLPELFSFDPRVVWVNQYFADSVLRLRLLGHMPKFSPAAERTMSAVV